jgi:hypothetical protein
LLAGLPIGRNPCGPRLLSILPLADHLSSAGVPPPEERDTLSISTYSLIVGSPSGTVKKLSLKMRTC